MEEWKEYKYTDCALIIGGGTPKTTEKTYWNGNIPWLSVKDFCGGAKYVYTSEKTITDLGLKNSSTKLLNKDDIIISARGTVGEIAMIPFEMAFNQSCFGIRANKNLITPDFLYYLTKTKVRELKNASHGSVFDTITKDTFDNISCEIPSIEYQKKVVDILKFLDDKIELNRRINENLEQQAQALFKSWFVDFEPFKDGKFVDSELGMIPEGWKVLRADEVFNINIGKTPPRKESVWFSNYEDSNIKWVSISDMGNCGVFIGNSSEYLTEEAVNKFNIIIVPKNTVLLSFKLTVGRVAIAKEELTTNEAIARFYLPDFSYREFTYLTLKNYDYAKLGSTSSIATAVNSKIIKVMKILLPNDENIKMFNSITKPIFDLIEFYSNEIDRLANLRDTLLPKLMSGELKINDFNNLNYNV